MDAMAIITGDGNNNTLFGTPNADTISGLGGNDTINGGPGDDILIGGAGSDTLNGGQGSDTYQIGLGDGFDTFLDIGTLGYDRIVAVANTVAIGLKSGFGPASGIEEISANGHSGVSIRGGDLTNDLLDFSQTTLTGIVAITGGGGNDTITGSAGADTILGNLGNDVLAGGAGNDSLDGGQGADTLKGGLGADTLIGGAGNDTLDGGAGSDTYQVGVDHGFDTYADTGASGTDRIVAVADGVAIGLKASFSGIEEISANGHANVRILGDATNDALSFLGITLIGIAAIDGGGGNDTITGSAVADTILGNLGNDVLAGGAGNDTLDGGEGADWLKGGLGADTLIGGAGSDTLDGGAGSDTYQVGLGHGFDTYADTGASGTDRIVAVAD